jgi:hypothetical protein
VIASWRTEGYLMTLEDTGDRGARIVVTHHGKNPREYGSIRYDESQSRHFIEWNRSGCLALEQYKRDHWDTKFYTAMARPKMETGS